jgi:Ribbon-helix-helix protein, copG family
VVVHEREQEGVDLLRLLEAAPSTGRLPGHAGTPRHIVVYSDTMRRTQIYLGSEELELLDRVARVTGASRSELVRRAVRSTFGQPTKGDKLHALAVSAGSWRGRDFSGSGYVDSVRGDLSERLGRLGLE